MLRREIARTFEHRITLECLVRASSFVVSTKLVAQVYTHTVEKKRSSAPEHEVVGKGQFFYWFNCVHF